MPIDGLNVKREHNKVISWDRMKVLVDWTKHCEGYRDVAFNLISVKTIFPRQHVHQNTRQNAILRAQPKKPKIPSQLGDILLLKGNDKRNLTLTRIKSHIPWKGPGAVNNRTRVPYSGYKPTRYRMERKQIQRDLQLPLSPSARGLLRFRHQKGRAGSHKKDQKWIWWRIQTCVQIWSLPLNSVNSSFFQNFGKKSSELFWKVTRKHEIALW